MPTPRYQRVLLKISCEGFCREGASGIDHDALLSIAQQCRDVNRLGVELAIVIGGGNFIRGQVLAQRGISRVTADHMGMLATVINALAIEMRTVAEPYIRRRAIRHLEKGRVVIFGGGTGNPYFSTDTAAALRAMEIGADVLIKATQVDGVYDSDPKRNPAAKKFDRVSHIETLNRRLEVMDSTAISLCMDNKLPILVLNLWDPNALRQALLGEPVGTLVTSE